MAEKTILVVDDNIVNHHILCKILKESGYRVLEAMNGQEAFDLISDSENQVSIILLDLVMPVLDGFGLLKKMRETGLISTIPVIVLTGNDEQETEIRCLEEGASDFLKKPYNAQLVRHKVASILRLWDNAMLISKLEIDELTGVYNKECFYRKSEEKLAADPEQAYMMLYLNIEDFKMINAHYGAQLGDQLLKYLGGILKKKWGETGICGRIGADNFGVLLKADKLVSQEEVGKFYENVMEESPVKGVNIKCGVYYVTDPSQTVAVMCDYAKIAEESVKHHYGLFYGIYDESMSQNAMRDHQLANYMEEALREKQFLVYLQPKHSTETGAVAGAEALVRWIHPELGFISPGEFIPLFEKNGFIVKLDAFVWEEVCRVLHQWQEEGIELVPVSVNASRADFLLSDLPEYMDELIDQYDIDPRFLHVEVTESAYTDNPEQIISMVSTLRDMGFKIEMDDFGSGYSSLNMLSELPIDILKLDMRFMQSGKNEQLKGSKRNILSFIVSLSKWLQLPTVAEGVETKSEVEDLKSMGVNLIQGYVYAKPMPIADFKEYMQNHRAEKKEVMPDIPEMLFSELGTDPEGKPLILVVEDIESNRRLMKKILFADYRIETAENGAIAYEYIKEHCQEISCVLLDLLMPVMDGFQVLELLHHDAKLSEIPVIITTETGSNGELRALNLGAHSFVAKPYNPDVLKHHVRKAVEERSFLRMKQEYMKRASTLFEKAYRDELTGFLNRYGLKEALKQLPEDMTHAVIALDIDRLKHVNDSYGHPVGDEVIAAIAHVIRRNTRGGDILSRIGGDEFVIVLQGMSDPERTIQKIRQICELIENIDVKNDELQPSCSAGVSFMEHIDEYEEVYQQADQALYQAKSAGRGTCTLWKK